MSDSMSDAANFAVNNPLTDEDRQTFQERIAGHLRAILVAARDMQLTAAPDLGQKGIGVRLADRVEIVIEIPPPGAIVLHVPLDPAGCAESEVPIIITYVGGHLASGEAYYVQDAGCV